jgi:hypothetical protein
MMKIVLIILFIFIILDRAPTSQRYGVGYRPVLDDGLNCICPPGHPMNGPNVRWKLGGTRWPWDKRPRWLWDEMWHVGELPYGLEWADKLRDQIRVRTVRPPPPAPMRKAD